MAKVGKGCCKAACLTGSVGLCRRQSDSCLPEVVAVTMLCVDEPCAGQAVELLPHLFDLFPDKASRASCLHSPAQPLLSYYRTCF